jgi:two-component system, NtrC family, sensor kinase
MRFNCPLSFSGQQSAIVQNFFVKKTFSQKSGQVVVRSSNRVYHKVLGHIRCNPAGGRLDKSHVYISCFSVMSYNQGMNEKMIGVSRQDQKLKEACRLGMANWAAWLLHRAESWELGNYYGLTKKKQKSLLIYLATPKINTWLSGAIANNRIRSHRIIDNPDFDNQHIAVFPNHGKQSALIVGGSLSPESRRLFQLLASFGPDIDYYPEMNLDSQVVFRPFDAVLEPAYDLQGVLQQVLGYLTETISASAALIALRAGSTFAVRAVSAMAENVVGREIELENNNGLIYLVENKRGFIDNSLKPALIQTLPVPQNPASSWLFMPIVLGQRVTGFVGFWRGSPPFYQDEDLTKSALLVDRSAHLIENAIIFSEAARYLQQLALINELAAAASSGSDINEVAERLMIRLRRVFYGAKVSLMLRSSDGEWMREFGEKPADDSGFQLQPSIGSLAGYVAESGKPLRISTNDTALGEFTLPPEVKAKLVVPLRYRGKVIGVLDLSSNAPDVFSNQDEQLLVMIAGHMAGLIENVRLNDETRKRAQNLNLIHQVVQRVVGLTDANQIAQVASGLLVEQFDYDFAAVLLINLDQTELFLAGAAGIFPVQADFRTNYPLDSGMIWGTYASGISRMETDLSQQDIPHPITGIVKGAEMCVLLQGDKNSLGVIDVLRTRPHSFTENDMLALEALAGVLSSVLMNASRYQQLQTSVRQLEAARETALEIAGDLDLDILLRRVVRRARELIGARGAELALVDETAEIVRIVVSENPWRDFTGTEVPFMSGVEGKVAVLGEPVVINDYNQWSGRLYPERHMPYRSVAGIPLKLKGQVIGVLLVSDDRPERIFMPADLQMLEFFAAQAAIFIRNARLYQEIQERMEAQREAEMQLIRSARLAAVGEMAAGVAHELNNPLTTVAGFIELVMDDLSADAPQKKDLELVLREAKRARGVVRRLLDFSRPSDNLRLRTDINELVSEVLTLVQHLVRTNGVELRVQLTDELPWISVDPNQIKQVLLNLVHNALQAMPRGGILNVETSITDKDDKNWLTVAVRDNGVGIDPAVLERIFEPFFTTRPVGSGTGLGLSVSYGIITEHNGFIEVESIVGEGSRFTIWLPVEHNG